MEKIPVSVWPEEPPEISFPWLRKINFWELPVKLILKQKSIPAFGRFSYVKYKTGYTIRMNSKSHYRVSGLVPLKSLFKHQF